MDSPHWICLSDWDWNCDSQVLNKTLITHSLSVQTEDGDYLALTGQPKKQEEDSKLEEAGTDYSEDYDEDYGEDYEEEAGVAQMFLFHNIKTFLSKSNNLLK